MTTINFKDFYPWYTHDEYIEVSEEVADELRVSRLYDATTITKRMVAELIQYIEVYPAVKEDGITNQRVTIHYNCIGAFEVQDRRKIPEWDILLETRKGVASSYAPTQIAI